jgi:hypothetical protein
MLPTEDEEVPTPTSSLNFTSTGELLAGAFQDITGAAGGIAISNSSVSAVSEFFVDPTTEIRGATGLMIHDDFLYVSGLFSGKIRRFALSEKPALPKGQMDPSWLIPNLAYPQDLALAPDGNGFLAGILGAFGGGGSISRYTFEGTFVSKFAEPAPGGFTEATAFVVVPTPLIGDFNRDGVVDAADYVVWRNASPGDTLPNDDTPGIVDASDYNDWRSNFGKSGLASAASLGVSPVPEPALMTLLILTIVPGLFALRRSR